MTLRVLLGVALAFSLPRTAVADWLQLKDGTRLRGVDLEAKGTFRCFTLDSGLRIRLQADQIASYEKSPPGETVEHRGRQVTLREMIREKARLLRAERAKREKQAIRDVEAWARGSKRAEEAKKAIDALPASDRERFLGATILKSSVAKARSLAASQLGATKSPRHIPVLASAVVCDSSRQVRLDCVAAIQTIGDPSAGDAFVPHLKSASSASRIRAAGAIEIFPTKRAVPYLIERMGKVWADFGRSFVFQGVERSYIEDYNLVSGGTGFSLVEVADPEIAKVTTGVVLDADVRRVEAIACVLALRKTTGQDFGPDPARWAAWWREHKAEERAKEKAQDKAEEKAERETGQ